MENKYYVCSQFMIKYIFGILISALFILGLHLDSDIKQQKSQSQTVTLSQNVQIRSLSNCSVSTASNKQFNEICHTLNYSMSDYEISDGILADFSSFRNATTPSKILKYHIVVARQIFNLSDVQLPGNKWQGFSPDANYIKYSNKYYVYTLGHILI